MNHALVVGRGVMPHYGVDCPRVPGVSARHGCFNNPCYEPLTLFRAKACRRDDARNADFAVTVTSHGVLNNTKRPLEGGGGWGLAMVCGLCSMRAQHRATALVVGSDFAKSGRSSAVSRLASAIGLDGLDGVACGIKRNGCGRSDVARLFQFTA